MRNSRARRSLALAAVALLAAGAFVPLSADAGPVDSVVDTNAAPGGFMSDNITWLGNIAVDVPAIGARVVTAGDQRRLYVTGLAGLSIYDVTDPTVPIPLGHLALPHFENEDVEVSDDGSRVLISNDRFGNGQPVGLFVIDASIPQAPVIDQHLVRASHTVTCVDARCEWVYNRDGDIYWLDAPGGAAVYTGGQGWLDQVRLQLGQGLSQRVHDLNVDDAGYVIADTVPRLMIDVSTPRNPVLVARSTSEQSQGRIAYQHNNQRPDAADWVSRPTAYTGGALGAGELLLANGETNFTNVPAYSGGSGVFRAQACDGTTNGPFATWDMADFDKGRRMRPIEVFRPVQSNVDGDPTQAGNRPWMDGNPQLNVSGCSGHWFSHLPADANGQILVAAGWYEHGTRILSVDQATGDIDEVGFFQPVVSSTWAAHWITDDIVYTIDASRGIDIFRFDRSAATPSTDELYDSWTSPLASAAVGVSEQARYACTLAIISAS